MLVDSVRVRALRSLDGFELELPAGLIGVHGPNGAGKTNLLEAIYFALTGRSFRTTDRRELIPFGTQWARVEVGVTDSHGLTSTFAATVSRTEGRRHLLDGKPVDSGEASRRRPHVLVFSPDRLAIIKGPPAERRAHIDSFAAASDPRSVGLRRAYGQALAQRNAILGRVAAGESDRGAVATWDRALARAAVPLIEGRSASIEALAPEFATAADVIGIEEAAALSYRPRATGTEEEIASELERRLESDLRNRRTGWGPHLDELQIDLGGRAVRRYGSQGQQRAALLALLLAERSVLERAHVTPLMLFDDVMSELDPARRDRLGSRLSGGGQCLITAADRSLLPAPYLAAEVALGSDREPG